MKGQIALGFAALVGVGSYAGLADSADVVRTVDQPIDTVYREFASAFAGQPISLTLAPGQLPNELSGTLTTSFVREKNEELTFEAMLDGDRVARIHFRFDAISEKQTRLSADFDVDAAILPSGEMKLSQWQVDTAMAAGGAAMMDRAVAELNRGGSVKLALGLQSLDFARSAMRMMQDVENNLAVREHKARERQEAASAPMVDPDAVAREHIRETQGSDALRSTY